MEVFRAKSCTCVMNLVDVFCVSGHHTYACRMSFMYMHVGGGALVFNVPGSIIESPDNTSYHREGIGNNCSKFCVNLTN